MKAIVVTPKSDNEFKFVADLLKKLGIGTSTLTKGEIEDIGMLKLMNNADKSKRVSRTEIMKKLTA
jgi:intein/homing endonuclease